MKFTAALAQTSPKLGDLRANLTQHLHLLTQAHADGADLIVFPELALAGYFLQDLLYETAIRPTADDPTFGPLLEATKTLDLDAVFSFPEVDSRSRYYISAAYVSRGVVTYVHRKVYLPNYGMFTDARFFTPGDQIRAFDTRFGRAGMLICEDFWHVSAPYLLWLDGADLLLLPTDSPGRGVSTAPEIGTALWSEKLTGLYGTLFGAHVLYCNRVGFEDGINFFGGSCAVDPDGNTLVRAPQMDESLTLVTLDTAQVRRSRAVQPLLRDEQTALTLRELQRIIGTP